MMPTAVYSLEEELHAATLKLRGLPIGAAIVKRHGQFPARIRTDMARPGLASAKRVAQFVESARIASPCVSPLAVADAEIAARHLTIEGMPAASKDTSFWSADDAE
jgi:hypothetical protein